MDANHTTSHTLAPRASQLGRGGPIARAGFLRAAGAAAALLGVALLPACDDAAYDEEQPDAVTRADRVAPPPVADATPPAGAERPARASGVIPAAWRVERTAMDNGAGESVVLRVPTPGGGDGLLVERMHPTEVRVGEPIEYTIAVENISELAMHDIRIKEWRSQGIEVVDVSAPNLQTGSRGTAYNGTAYNGSAYNGTAPDARGNGQNAGQNAGQNGRQNSSQNSASGPAAQSGPSDVWTISQLMPGQSETIQVTALAQQEGQVGVCMTVSYEPVVCLTTDVVQPDLLILKVVEQDQAFVCDPVEIVYIIENIGTGAAEGVRVAEPLPRGLTDANGATEVAFTVPTIASGETAEQRVVVQAQEPGVYASFATATSGELRARTRETPIRFVRPQLEMRVDAPSREYVGRDVPLRVTVRNTSEWPAIETRLAIPAMADLSRVSVSTQSGPMEDGTIMIGRLEPGETRTVELRFAADRPRDHDIEVIADAYCALPVAQAVGVEVLGIEAVRLETVDLVDPVAVGQQTVYEVRVKNQGSAESINVRVRAMLPDQMSFVSADGDSPVRANGAQLEFAPIDRLAPGDVATWRVTALAEAPGKTRLRLELTSDATRSAIIEQEPTTLIPAPVVPADG